MKHLYILLFVLPLIGFGQGWEETYGYYLYNNIQSVQPTDDGGYIVCGSTSFTNLPQIQNYGDMYILKVDESGDEIWSRIYENGHGFSIQPTNDGGYIITGTRKGEDSWCCFEDFYIMKINENGDSLWTNSFGGEHTDKSLSIQQTIDGGYVMFGWSKSKSNISSGNYNYDSDYWMLKTDENGDSLWSKSFGKPGFDWGRDIHQNIDGGYLLIGDMNSLGFSLENGQDRDMYLIKTDENGDSLWSKNYGNFDGEISYDEGYSIEPTTDGGYVITGGKSGGYTLLIKTDENGDSLWTQTFNIGGGLFGKDVHQTIDGGYILLTTNTGLGLIKTNENGEEEWSRIFDQGEYWGEDVSETLDGGYIITGTKYFGSESQVGFLIKTDSQGNITSTIELPTPTSKRELIKTTNILGQENTTIKNQPLIEIYDDGSTEKKIVLE